MKLLINIRNFKINAQVCICSQANLNIGHIVELTFLVGMLGRFVLLHVTFLKWRFLSLLRIENKNKMRTIFSSWLDFLDPYHKKSTHIHIYYIQEISNGVKKG